MRPTPCSTAKMYDGVSGGLSSTGSSGLAMRECSFSPAVPGERRSGWSSQTCFTSSASVVSYPGWGAAPPSSPGPTPGFLPSISVRTEPLPSADTDSGETDSENCHEGPCILNSPQLPPSSLDPMLGSGWCAHSPQHWGPPPLQPCPLHPSQPRGPVQTAANCVPVAVTTVLGGHKLKFRLGCRPRQRVPLDQGCDASFTQVGQASLGLSTSKVSVTSI